MIIFSSCPLFVVRSEIFAHKRGMFFILQMGYKILANETGAFEDFKPIRQKALLKIHANRESALATHFMILEEMCKCTGYNLADLTITQQNDN